MVMIIVGGHFQQGQDHQGELYRIEESDPQGDPSLRAEVVLAEHVHEPTLTAIHISGKGDQAGEQTARTQQGNDIFMPGHDLEALVEGKRDEPWDQHHKPLAPAEALFRDGHGQGRHHPHRHPVQQGPAYGLPLSPRSLAFASSITPSVTSDSPCSSAIRSISTFAMERIGAGILARRSFAAGAQATFPRLRASWNAATVMTRHPALSA